MTKPIDGAANMIRDLDWKLEYLVALDADAVSRGAKEAGMQEVEEDLARAVAFEIVSRCNDFEHAGAHKLIASILDEFTPGKTGKVAKEICSWLHQMVDMLREEARPRTELEARYGSLFFLDAQFSCSFTSDTGPARLFSIDDVAALIERDDRAEGGQQQLYRSIISRLLVAGPYREYRFRDGTVGALMGLANANPHFRSVIEYIAEAIKLASDHNRPLAMPPILIQGAPGIGKTYIVNQIKEVLGVVVRSLALDNLQLGSTIAGADSLWANSHPGVVFDALINGDHLSPIIVLDEIDKASPNATYGDSLGSLHTLLEPESAKSFTDGWFQLPIDASNVIWIATANNLDRLDPPLRSRFTIFEIPSPDVSTRRFIASSLVNRLIETYPGIEFTEEALALVEGLSSRHQLRVLTAAIARANWRETDWVVEVFDVEDVLERERSGRKLRRSLGY
ncbi:AAA family ATPase [Ferrimicrobium sp.]|uniref:AAA family ATPase n=1 Tax=Ferrimicrobium sp. TaxID=2926050 RepID=UPI002637D31D|nr:AAA family ATPase [Ferrimicrobium sp.]